MEKITSEILQAQELIESINYIPLMSGLDSWKEKKIEEYKELLKALPTEAVEAAKKIVSDKAESLKKMTTERMDKPENQRPADPEIDGRFYF